MTSIIGSVKFLRSYCESLGIANLAKHSGPDEKGKGKVFEETRVNLNGKNDHAVSSRICKNLTAPDCGTECSWGGVANRMENLGMM
jgi:hypothetical protein